MAVSYDRMDELPADVIKDLKRVRDHALKDLQDVECPAEIMEIVRGSDPESLNLVTELWYRPPWEVVLGSFQRGAVTVAGDAMHAMGPFIGQGGSAGLEDAVVLARSLARAAVDDGDDNAREKKMVVGEAIGEYVRERRPRLALLSLESFVMGALLVRSPSPVTKLVCVAVLILLGSKSLRHANYDCGRL
jgi:2-polyprenyl-6-methoxyphenol hydroxylase-like FAD-dependent oxidoreductase